MVIAMPAIPKMRSGFLPSLSIKFKAAEYDPDLIIVGFCPANDHEIPSNEIFNQPYKVMAETYPFYKSHVLMRLKSEFRRLKQIDKGEGKINNAVMFTEEEKNYMSRIFSDMRAYGKQNNVPIIIVYLSYRNNEKYANKLEEIVVNNGLNFTNVSLNFKKNLKKYIIYRTDHHPNKEANRIFAEDLYSYLNSFLED